MTANPARVLETREEYLAALIDRHLSAGLLEPSDLKGVAFVTAVNNLSSRLTRDFEQTHRPTGVSYAGFRILAILWVTGKAEPSRIARLADASPASVSSALNSLEDGGFIVRNRGAPDRRVVEVALTDAGQRLTREAIARQTERERAWTARLSESELDDLVRILGKVCSQPDPE